MADDDPFARAREEAVQVGAKALYEYREDDADGRWEDCRSSYRSFVLCEVWAVVRALAAAGLLRDQPAETWTEPGWLDKATGKVLRGWGTVLVADDATHKRTVSAGPWRPVEDSKGEDDDA